MVLIFASSITLVIQSPLDDPSKTKAKILSGIDLSMTALFCCEMVLKVRDREGLTISKIQNVLHTFTGVMAIHRGVSNLTNSHHDDSRYRPFNGRRLHVELVGMHRAPWVRH